MERPNRPRTEIFQGAVVVSGNPMPLPLPFMSVPSPDANMAGARLVRPSLSVGVLMLTCIGLVGSIFPHRGEWRAAPYNTHAVLAGSLGVACPSFLIFTLMWFTGFRYHPTPFNQAMGSLFGAGNLAIGLYGLIMYLLAGRCEGIVKPAEGESLTGDEKKHCNLLMADNTVQVVAGVWALLTVLHHFYISRWNIKTAPARQAMRDGRVGVDVELV